MYDYENTQILLAFEHPYISARFRTSRIVHRRPRRIMTKSLILIGLCCIQPMRPQSQSVSAPAPVTLSPTSLSFVSQTVGTTSATSAVKLTNNQATALTISSIVASGDFAVVQNSTCGASLASGKS